MKLWLKILCWFLFSSLVFLVIRTAKKEESDTEIAYPEVFIDVKGENAFLNENELKNRLKRKGLVYPNQPKDSLNIHKIESFIQNMSEVLEVKVFVNIGNSWKIVIRVRKPIARIFNAYGESYYLDELGYMIRNSYLYTARVVVVSGEIEEHFSKRSVSEIINNKSLKSKSELDDIYRISSYVCKDPFFNSQIGQIYLEKNGDFLLVPRVGDQKIIFGTAHNRLEVSTKFRKLADFYAQGIPYEGWSTYNCINLKYKNQVVCSKKENNIEK